MKKFKRVGVLFSSGLDSTYLVWKNLRDGNEVYPIYVDIENNGTKSKIEKNRIELLYKEFDKEFNHTRDFKSYKIHEVMYPVKLGVNNANEDSLYFKQVPIWLFTLIFCQSLRVDEFQIGYVTNDDAIPFLSDIKKVYESYQVICEPMKPLVFPLVKMKKWQMAHELPYQYRELIYSCENPTIIGSETAEVLDYEACCECVPCKAIISTDYYHLRNYPKNYHKNLLRTHIHAIKNSGYKVFDSEGKEYDYWDCNCQKAKQQPIQLKLNFDYGWGLLKEKTMFSEMPSKDLQKIEFTTTNDDNVDYGDVEECESNDLACCVAG